MTITHYDSVFVAFRIQHAMRMRHIVICGLPRCTTFFHIISQTARFLRKKKVIERKMCVLIFSKLLSEMPLVLGITERDMIKQCTLVFL